MPFTETMTPRQRVMNVLTGAPVDRPPVCNPTNVATVELMDLVEPHCCIDGYRDLSLMRASSVVKRQST